MDLDLTETEIIMSFSSKLLVYGIVNVKPAKQIGRELVKWQETYTLNIWHSIAPQGLPYLVHIPIIYTCFGSA